jgi:hypothetical protein
LLDKPEFFVDDDVTLSETVNQFLKPTSAYMGIQQLVLQSGNLPFTICKRGIIRFYFFFLFFTGNQTDEKEKDQNEMTHRNEIMPCLILDLRLQQK